jgi:hypothetical protein
MRFQAKAAILAFVTALPVNVLAITRHAHDWLLFGVFAANVLLWEYLFWLRPKLEVKSN